LKIVPLAEAHSAHQTASP